MYKQWVNSNVVRKDKNTYEIHAVLDGRFCKILMKRDDNDDNIWKATTSQPYEEECD